MDYTLERFNLDMRKVNLFAETAYSEYAFTVEETFMDESVNDYEVEAVITEAADGLLNKIKAAFAKIIESIKKFFANLIEKVKNFFAGLQEGKLKGILSKNPAIAKKKVQVPDVKEIEEVCGKRAILRKKMLAEYKKGTLTRDKFEQMKEQSDKLGKRLKTVGAVTLAIGAVVGSAFGATKLIQKLKKSEASAAENVEELKKAEQKAMQETIHKPEVAAALNPQTGGNRITSALRVPTEEPTPPRQEVTAYPMVIPGKNSSTSGVTVATEITKQITEEEKIALEADLAKLRAARAATEVQLKNLTQELAQTSSREKVLNDKYTSDKIELFNAQSKGLSHSAYKAGMDELNADYSKAESERRKRQNQLDNRYTIANQKLSDYDKQIYAVNRKLGQ